MTTLQTGLGRLRDAALAAAIAATAAATAAPARAEALASTVSFAIVETDAEGEEQLVERASVKPGETIQYNLEHVNGADFDMSGLAITAPVPEGATVLLDSATSSRGALFEIQAELEPAEPGLEWSALPAYRLVTDPDGTERREPVPADAIAAVRWNLEAPLPSGESALNSYRVTVD